MGRRELTPEQRTVLLAEREFREQAKRDLAVSKSDPAARKGLPGLPAPAPEPAKTPDLSSVADLVAETPLGDRGALIARLYRAFEGQVAQLEARLTELLGAGSGSLTEIDQTVKTLASLAKTLNVLMDLQKEQAEDAGADDSPDPEDLRAQLADRLGRLCSGRAD